MKKSKIVCAALAALMVFSSFSAMAYASDSDDEAVVKDETVYVIANANGEAEKIMVSDRFAKASSEAVKAALSKMSESENVKDDDCYISVSDKELPVKMKITYTLDGKKISAEDLAGKSGRVNIRFDYENTQKEETANGTVYVPFAVISAVILDSEHFSNVSAVNGKVVDDGERTVALGVTLPGMQQTLGIDDESLDIPEHFEISADAENFELSTTLTIVTNSVFNEMSTEDLDELGSGDLTDSISQLTSAMLKLMAGSDELYSGIKTLNEKTDELQAGVNNLYSGLSTLDSKSEELNGGAKQVFETLLAEADKQLAAAGLESETMTIENYEEVLTGVLETLDNAGTTAEKEVKAQIESKVRENEAAIRSGVEQAVKANVSENVHAQVKQSVWESILAQNGLDQDSYNAGVEAGTISEETQNALNMALSQAMESDEVKAKEAAALEAAMQSDEVQSTIDAKTEEQVQLLIQQNFTSKEVQDKIMEITRQAGEGAVKIRALKQQLDSYNTFYTGLLAYTAGVGEAAAGAGELNDNMPALKLGITKLETGAKALSDGLKEFNEKGVGKIAEAFGGSLAKAPEKLKAALELSKEYNTFSGIKAQQGAGVKFIIRTEEIKAK